MPGPEAPHRDPVPRTVDAPSPRERQVHLTPPPRPTRPSRSSSRRSGPREREGGVPPWVGLLLLAVLGIGAFAVFALLPGWVESRDPDRLPLEAGDPKAVAPAGSPAPHLEAPAEPSSRTSPPATAAATSPTRSPATLPPPSSGGPPADAVDPLGESFRAAMSDGLTALERKDWATAREALERARSMRPDAPQVADALARVETGEKIAALAAFRTRAREHEATERWRRAEASYRAALALDPTVAFARKGLARATARAEMAETLRYHLDHPERLSSLAVLDEVAALVERARDMEPAGPEHRRRVAELARQVTEWSKPVTARLVSDGQTRVTLHRVGTLGTFTLRKLDLRPGTYTAVGQRPGYRDVRRELVIRPGRPPEPLRVICDEEI